MVTWKAVSEISDEPLGDAEKVYFRARTRRDVHAAVLKRFEDLQEHGKMNKIQLASRLGVHPSQVTRWLSTPGNWTIDTLSDLLLAMGARARIEPEDLASVRPGNHFHPLSTPVGNHSSLGEQDFASTTSKTSAEPKVEYKSREDA